MSSSTVPLISVVIPTRNRPELVTRAVKSALAQTLVEIEVIVVIDGIDDMTIAALTDIADARLHTIALHLSVGGSEARNIGVRSARGEFVALLDDDDEWHPSKLSAQLAAARGASHPYPVVTSRLIARRPDGEEIWPLRAMRDEEPISEYLFCRESSIRQGEGFIQTSTLLIPRTLMLEVPFASGLQRHQDWDWLIRAAAHPGVGIVWAWKPLVIYHIDAGRKSISAGSLLGPSINWIDGNNLITSKARAYFYATQIAVRCSSLGVFVSVVCNTLRYPRAFLIAIGLALVPRSLVNQLRPKSTTAHA